MKHTFAGDPDKHILLLVIRSVGGMDAKKKDNPDELSFLVAERGLEPLTSGL